jgi:hypothetical protein
MINCVNKASTRRKRVYLGKNSHKKKKSQADDGRL